jgi:hypothetical protein
VAHIHETDWSHSEHTERQEKHQPSWSTKRAGEPFVSIERLNKAITIAVTEERERERDDYSPYDLILASHCPRSRFFKKKEEASIIMK